MSHQGTHEEKQLVKLIEDMPFPDETKGIWIERIETDGLNEELVDEIHAALNSDSTQVKESTHLIQTNANFTRIVRQWRLTQQTQSYKKRS
jgi:hypothetical protein